MDDMRDWIWWYQWARWYWWEATRLAKRLCWWRTRTSRDLSWEEKDACDTFIVMSDGNSVPLQELPKVILRLKEKRLLDKAGKGPVN